MGLVEDLRGARWFGGKSRAIKAAHIVDRAAWVTDAELALVEVEYADDGPPDTYVLAERLEDPAVARALLDRFGAPPVPTEAGASLVFTPSQLFDSIPTASAEPISLMRGEQSNTSIRFGDALMLKLFRRVQFGPNPDVEVGYFLTEHTRFRGTPAVLGSVDYHTADGATASLVLLQQFERNRGDAWTTTLRRVIAILDGAERPDSVAEMARLAETTADLHVALASGVGEFSAEPIQDADIARWRQAILEEVQLAVAALSRRNIALDSRALVRRADGVGALKGARKIRHHGDYHLGQVLERDDGSYVIIDFEGEPAKPLAQRRARHSPLRDVAGMLRSLDYARHAALRAGDPNDPQRIHRAVAWYDLAREAFLGTYLEAVRRAAPTLLPDDALSPLAALQLEKAAYELLYELNNRPDWLPIPLAALQASATLALHG